MAEFFDVQYNINVVSQPAVTAINSFVRATEQLTKATGNLMKFKESLAQLETLGTTKIPLRIDASQALKKLQQVENKINEIKNRAASSIKINVTGGVTGSGGKGTAKTRNVVTPAPTQSRQRLPKPQPIPQPIKTAKQQQPIQGAGGRMRPGIIPSNLRYEVLGPTRIGNVAMLDMFKGMGLMYGISAIGSSVRDILSTSAEYQNVMQTAKNILKTNYKGGGFEANFAEMERIARQVGMETKFTAPEVADAVKFFAMAGLDMDAIKKSIRPVADIALIGDTDLGTTADVMTNIMTAYRIKPEEMRKTADIMARTFTMSNTTLMELAESFKMSGSVLQQYGVPFEEAAAAFGVLGDAGIKSTMAGTTMRTIIANLRKPSKAQLDYWSSLGVRRIDEFGNRRNLIDIFADLSRVNNERGQADKALEEYRKLRETYDPKFDVLQEGSEEWRKLELEYNKKSDEIQKAFGGVDVFRLFRLTAASGGGVLVDSIDKWNKIMQENFMSAGISEKLADEKKNQIVGLWAQLKSAFQEQGLQIFEENEGKLRSYLDSAINWVKSAEFKNILKSIIDLVETLANQLKKFTGWVITLYDRFKPLVKLFLTFQLPLKMMTTVLGSALQVFYSFAYSLSPFARALTSATFLQRRTGLYGYVNAYGAAGMQAAGGQVAQTYGLGPMLGWYASRKNPEMYTRLMENGGNAKMAMRMDPRYNIMNTSANLPLYKQYKELEKRNNYANRLQARGMAFGIGGFLAGSYFGSAVAPESDWAPAIGGAIGSLGSVALASSSIPGAGWIAALVIAAAAGVGWVIKYTKECREARKSADEFAESLNKINVANWNIGSSSDYFVSMTRIRINALAEEKEKIDAQTEAWRKYYRAMNGETEEEDASSSTYMYNFEGVKDMTEHFTGKRSKQYADQLRSQLFTEGTMAEWERILEEAGVTYGVNEYDWQDYAAAYYGGVSTTLDPLEETSGLFLAMLAQKYKTGDQLITGFINETLPKISNESDIQKAVADFQRQFMTPSGELFTLSEQRSKTVDDIAKNLSPAYLLRYPIFNAIAMPYLQQQLNEFQQSARNLISTDENTARNEYIGQYFGHIFGNGNIPDFGTSEFDTKFAEWLAGFIEHDAPRQAALVFQTTLERFNDRNTSDIQKKMLLPMLNRTYWEQVLGADLSNIVGGYIAPTDDNQTPYGKDYIWNDTLKYWTKEGVPTIPNNWLFNQNTTPVETLQEPVADTLLSYFDPTAQLPETSQEHYRPRERRQYASNTPINITVHFDKALNIENVNQADWDSEEKAEFVAEVVRDTIRNAVETFNPNELTV